MPRAAPRHDAPEKVLPAQGVARRSARVEVPGPLPPASFPYTHMTVRGADYYTKPHSFRARPAVSRISSALGPRCCLEPDVPTVRRGGDVCEPRWRKLRRCLRAPPARVRGPGSRL